jgi:hypothetical protein
MHRSRLIPFCSAKRTRAQDDNKVGIRRVGWHKLTIFACQAHPPGVEFWPLTHESEEL